MYIELEFYFKRYNDLVCESNKCMENRRLLGVLYIYY